MSKPDWGTKRSCQNCGAKYYDLKRSPIVCPKCGTTFSAEVLLKPRRSRPAAKPKEAPAPKKAVVEAPSGDETSDEHPAVLEKDDEIEDLADSDDDDDKVLEDASELGEDDDMSDVVISDDDKDET